MINYTLSTCGLARFNIAYLWFELCHFTHLMYAPLDRRYPSRDFPFEKYFKHMKNNIKGIKPSRNQKFLEHCS